jgi:hypothetical protein
MCCCRNRLRRKYEKKKPAGKFKKISGWIFYFLPLVVVGLCATAHIFGSNYFTVGFTRIETGSLALIDHTRALLMKASPTLQTVVDNLVVFVNSSIDSAVDSVYLSDLDVTVIPPLNNMCTGLISAQQQVENIKTQQRMIASNTTVIKANTNLLVTSIRI